jgi:16S rRNA (guanine966-N2)-methyltransferase
MRVIAGSARGRTLQGPPRPKASGRPGIRPTSDMVRGAIFDMLDALGADYDRVLDLYAGSGALGIEALSRGAGTADFVDNDADAIATINANLAATRFADRARVHRMSASQAVSRLAGPYTLVLADPPYYDETSWPVVTAIAESPLVDDDTVFVVEHHRKSAPPETLGGLPMYRSRRHGDTVATIYARTGGDES